MLAGSWGAAPVLSVAVDLSVASVLSAASLISRLCLMLLDPLQALGPPFVSRAPSPKRFLEFWVGREVEGRRGTAASARYPCPGPHQPSGSGTSRGPCGRGRVSAPIGAATPLPCSPAAQAVRLFAPHSCSAAPPTPASPADGVHPRAPSVAHLWAGRPPPSVDRAPLFFPPCPLAPTAPSPAGSPFFWC